MGRGSPSRWRGHAGAEMGHVGAPPATGGGAWRPPTVGNPRAGRGRAGAEIGRA